MTRERFWKAATDHRGLYRVELSVVEGVQSSNQSTIALKLEGMLKDFDHLFERPSTLLPKIMHDHTIKLVEGAQSP